MVENYRNSALKDVKEKLRLMELQHNDLKKRLEDRETDRTGLIKDVSSLKDRINLLWV